MKIKVCPVVRLKIIDPVVAGATHTSVWQDREQAAAAVAAIQSVVAIAAISQPPRER